MNFPLQICGCQQKVALNTVNGSSANRYNKPECNQKEHKKIPPIQMSLQIIVNFNCMNTNAREHTQWMNSSHSIEAQSDCFQCSRPDLVSYLSPKNI